MKVKTADLIGPTLDWAVAKCEQPGYEDWRLIRLIEQEFRPSSNWAQGGPIIEQEHISVDNRKGDPCLAFKGTPAHYEFSMFAPEGQPLVAAMRCFVASKLGDEVDIPEELLS